MLRRARLLAGAGAATVLSAAAAAPLLATAAPTVSLALYQALGFSCLQDPNRGFWVAGLSTALCARCLGVWAAGALVFLFPWNPPTKRTCIGLAAAAGAAWALEGLAAPNLPAEMRFAAGVPLGIALAAPLAAAWTPKPLC